MLFYSTVVAAATFVQALALGAEMDGLTEEIVGLNSLDVTKRIMVENHHRSLNGIGGIWSQIGDNIYGEAAGDLSGNSVALSSDGTVVAIGAFAHGEGYPFGPGRVRVFKLNEVSGAWEQWGGNLDGEAAYDKFGSSVALSSDGTVVAIGGPNHGGGYGHVRVFKFNNGIEDWSQIGNDIVGEAEDDRSGHSVALSSDGTVVAIGAPFIVFDAPIAGHARIFKLNNVSSSWAQVGGDISGENADDTFGSSVALSSDGTVVAIGAPRNDGGTFTAGHVRVFKFNNEANSWIQTGGDINGEVTGDYSGRSVALSSDGTVVAVGAPFNDGSGTNYDSGHVRVFKLNTVSDVWEKLGGDLDGKAAYDEFGGSVDLSSDGTVVAIGARYNDDGNAGYVRVFKLDEVSGVWEQWGDDFSGIEGDYFGSSVALSSDGAVVAIGGPGNGNSAGHVRLFQYQGPSATPSLSPSNVPSQTPSASAEPSISDVPSLSTIPSKSVHPSLEPSFSPSNFPSQTPSFSPSYKITPLEYLEKIMSMIDEEGTGLFGSQGEMSKVRNLVLQAREQLLKNNVYGAIRRVIDCGEVLVCVETSGAHDLCEAFERAQLQLTQMMTSCLTRNRD